MYGLVNNGIQTFIVENHGEETWRAICAKAGVDGDSFETMSAYEDHTTFALVGAISEHLDLTTAQVLEVFGTYWVSFTKETAIGRLMRFEGVSLSDRLKGLDEMHDRVRLAMPHLDPPSFEYEESDDGENLLHYFSHREGLHSMVVGLLHGLAAETGEEIAVRMVESRAAGHDHDVFAIRSIGMTADAAA